jgi:hypothetical protein
LPSEKCKIAPLKKKESKIFEDLLVYFIFATMLIVKIKTKNLNSIMCSSNEKNQNQVGRARGACTQPSYSKQITTFPLNHYQIRLPTTSQTDYQMLLPLPTGIPATIPPSYPANLITSTLATRDRRPTLSS